jgi:hypothetical protein
LMEEAESQNVYPFRDDHTVFFRVAYSITKEALALSTRRTNDSEIIAGVWRRRHTLSWSQNYFRVAVMLDAEAGMNWRTVPVSHRFPKPQTVLSLASVTPESFISSCYSLYR